MSVLFLAVPIALLFAGGAVVAFWLAARQGQFDDLDTPAWRMLQEEERSNASGELKMDDREAG